jgi:hypothetical protein
MDVKIVVALREEHRCVMKLCEDQVMRIIFGTVEKN